MANRLNVDIPPGAKVVVAKKWFPRSRLTEVVMTEEERTVVVGGDPKDKYGRGFGCCSFTFGTWIFGTWLLTGEPASIRGQQIEKMIPPD